MKFKTKKIIVISLEILFFLAFLGCFTDEELTKYWSIYLFLAILMEVLRRNFFNKEQEYINNEKYKNTNNINITEPVIKENLNHLLENSYFIKPFLSSYELSFYNKIKDLNESYIIVPQVNLAAIIGKANSKYCNELFRNIDFGIFTKDFKLLLLIELNDKSHQKISRSDRDLKVKKILNDCNIPLLTFYTYYPNEKEYVINKITKTIESKILNN